MATTHIPSRHRRLPVQPKLDGAADDWVTFPATDALTGVRP
jgi:hypothetical protein